MNLTFRKEEKVVQTRAVKAYLLKIAMWMIDIQFVFIYCLQNSFFLEVPLSKSYSLLIGDNINNSIYLVIHKTEQMCLVC